MVVASSASAQFGSEAVVRELELAQGMALPQTQLNAALERSAPFRNDEQVERLRRPLTIRSKVLGCYGGQVGVTEMGFGLMGITAESPLGPPVELTPEFEKDISRAIVKDLRDNTVRTVSLITYRLNDQMPMDAIPRFTAERLCDGKCGGEERAMLEDSARQHLAKLQSDGVPRASAGEIAEEINRALARAREPEHHLREYYNLLSRAEAPVFYADGLRDAFFASLGNAKVEPPLVTVAHLKRAQAQVLRASRQMVLELRAANGSKVGLKNLLRRFPVALPRIVSRTPEVVDQLCPILKEIDNEKRAEVAVGKDIDVIFRWLSAGLLVTGGVVLVATVVGAWASPMLMLASRSLIVGLPLSVGQVSWSGYNYYRKNSELNLFVSSQLTGNLDPRQGNKYLELAQLRDGVVFDFVVNVGFLLLGTSMGQDVLKRLVRTVMAKAVTANGRVTLDRLASRMRDVGMRPRNEDEVLRYWARLSLPPGADEAAVQARVLSMQGVEAKMRDAKRLVSGSNSEAGDEVVRLISEVIDKGVSLK